MSRPKLLDLFCCQGGASMGYHRAGFEVVGVDLAPQPRYPFEFHRADALKFLLENWGDFDAYHASPPCQAHTNARKLRGNDHPDYIRAIREALVLIADHSWRPRPWVIENVPGSPVRADAELCGAMFGLRTYRHRLFESNVSLSAPEHPEHVVPTTKMGRAPRDGEFMHVVGNFSGVGRAREAMGIDWMTRDGLRESIPPAYAECIGRQLLAHIESERAA